MKKKILHLLSSKSYSGAENVAMNIIRNLKEDYEFIYVCPKGPIEEILKNNEVQYTVIEKMNMYSINKILKQWKPDIIHAHDFRASIKIAMSLYNCKKISHIHQNPSWIGSINKYSIAYMLTCGMYSSIVTASKEIYEEAVFSKFIKNKIKVIDNYVDKEEIIRKSQDEVCNDEYDIIYVGRLSEEKNPLKFIDLMNEIIKINKDLKIAIVGDGRLKEECISLINKLKIQNNISLVGFKSNPYPIINSSKILVMTSKWEGFGLVAVEAMILSKPVFAPPVGGLKSILDEDMGTVFRSDQEFIEKITTILDDTIKYSKVSKMSRNKSNMFTDVELWKKSFKDVYDLKKT